jgi:GNAT superfamily N-acetyltransferase
MWRDIGNRTETSVRAHGPVYRRWMLRAWRQGRFVAYIAEVDGQAAASGAIWWKQDQPSPAIDGDRVPYILSMYTAPAYRGRGLASRIVRVLVREAKEAGAVRIVLHASAQGRSVYERLGFQATNEMRRYLRKPRGIRQILPAPATARGRGEPRR